jgi:signal peptide peptidase SppA
MQPEWLHTMLEIADRTHTPDMEAVLAKRGAQLKDAPLVELRGQAAILSVHGPVFRYANLFTQMSGATSIEALAKDLDLALENPLVKTIVLDVDSPGGQVTGVSELAQMIRAAASRKPVVAYVGGVAASGGYWIASAAPRIVANDTALLGSIGVVATIDIDDDKNSVEIVSTQSPGKCPDVRSEAGRAQVQAEVDAIAEVFVSTVAANRGVSVAKVLENFGQGGVLIGRQAVVAGMADEVGTLEQLLAALDRRAPVPLGVPPLTAEARIRTTMTIEERCHAEWRSDPGIRSEFLELERYVAYSRAVAAGNVRMVKAGHDGEA